MSNIRWRVNLWRMPHANVGTVDQTHSLMVRERVSANSALKYATRVRILLDRAEVKHPVIIAVVVVQELLRIFSAIAIEALEASGRVSHNYDIVGNVCQILKNSGELGFSLRFTGVECAYLTRGQVLHLCSGPCFRRQGGVQSLS